MQSPPNIALWKSAPMAVQEAIDFVRRFASIAHMRPIATDVAVAWSICWGTDDVY